MKIYFGGCSATYGDELESPIHDAWPTQIAKHYNAEFLNNGIRGGSNDIIWKEAVYNLHDYDKFYIQWTHISRMSLRDPHNQLLIQFTNHLNALGYDNKDYYQTFGKYYFSYWNNPVENYIDFLNYVISLQALFEANGKEYVMLFPTYKVVHPFNLGFKDIEPYWFENTFPPSKNLEGKVTKWFHAEIPNRINKLQDRIDKSRFVYDGTFSFVSGSPEFGILPPEFPEGHEVWHENKGHASAKAHETHAKLIIEWEEKQKLKGKENESN